nr:MAG TPA: hypothetical protein [Caudoviricetes sp.]
MAAFSILLLFMPAVVTVELMFDLLQKIHLR